jgi:hypothetical protein
MLAELPQLLDLRIIFHLDHRLIKFCHKSLSPSSLPAEKARAH